MTLLNEDDVVVVVAAMSVFLAFLFCLIVCLFCFVYFIRFNIFKCCKCILHACCRVHVCMYLLYDCDVNVPYIRSQKRANMGR